MKTATTSAKGRTVGIQPLTEWELEKAHELLMRWLLRSGRHGEASIAQVQGVLRQMRAEMGRRGRGADR